MTVTMKSLLALVSVAGLAACSSMSTRDYAVTKGDSDDDEYVYILDYEKIALIEEASRTSSSNVETYWVNPPLKRITRAELAKLRAKQQ